MRGKYLRGILLALLVVVCLLPLVWTVLASFNIQPDELFTPPTWTTANGESYIEVFIAEPLFPSELAMTFGIATLTTLLAVGVGFLAAFSLTHSRWRLHDSRRTLIVQSFLILASLPVVAYLIPLQATMTYLRLHDTFAGIVLAESAAYTPLAVYVLYGYLRGLSVELEESARLDGASLGQILTRVALPAAASGVVATAVIVFVFSWNQFLIPVALTAVHVRTIPVMMRDFFTLERELEWPKAAAALVVGLAPIGLFVALAHRGLERFTFGMVAGKQ
jgi:ABC-type glycerol-3-phosphate transport system permease component